MVLMHNHRQLTMDFDCGQHHVAQVGLTGVFSGNGRSLQITALSVSCASILHYTHWDWNWTTSSLGILNVKGRQVVRAWNVVHMLSKLLSPAAKAIRYSMLERGESYPAEHFGRHLALKF